MIDPADLRDVFDRAASLPPQDRAAFLARTCGENLQLRQEVERLLAADARAGSVFSSGDSSDGDSGQRETGGTLRADLAPGTRLGPYVLVGSLGAGGMGEVYKARDTRLDRSVAIKVLPADLVRSPEARQRFEREAKAAAALAHAHICRLLDVGRHGDTDYLVMELLEGETLASRLLRGRLPLRQVLTFATQIANALAEAQRAGIVHRDLKPGNIMLTRGGAVLLDFGLARQTAPITVDAPTATLNDPITRTGVILGTVQYMAPEQLQGLPVDARTDIFAFGAVLYEMVTGRRPFEGANPASVIGNILHADPPALTTVEAMTPPALDRLVRRCLAKDPSERWQSAGDVLARLEAIQDVTRDDYTASASDRDGAGGASPRTVDRPVNWRRRILYAGTAIVVACAVAAFSIYRNASPRPQPGSTTSTLRSLTRLTFGELDGFATFSPDGRFIVFVGAGGLWVRATGGGNPVQITKSSADALPDWSPDGTSIAFVRTGEGVFLVSPLGGQERRVASFGDFPMWSPDSKQLLFATKPFSSAIKLFLAVPDRPPQQILASFLEGGEWNIPAWHPDGRITLAGTHRTEGFGIYTISVQDGHWTKTTLPSELLAGTNIDFGGIQVFSWGPSGDFLYASCPTTGGTGNVWRLQVDDALRVTALERMSGGQGADWYPKVSRDGKRILFTAITGQSRLWRFPFKSAAGDRVGDGQPLSEEDGEINWASLSRDGRKLAHYYLPLNAPSARQSEVRLLSSPFTDPPQRIPADRYVRMASAWSHQGDRLALQAAELSSSGAVVANVLLVREPDGSERVVARCQSAPQAGPCRLAPVDWTADDLSILATTRLRDEPRSRLCAWRTSVEGPSDAPAECPVVDWEWNVSQGRYSPDGRWLAFAYGGGYGDEKGIAVVPAAGKGLRTSWHLIVDGFEDAGNPSWSTDGHLLYFTSSHLHLGTVFLNVWRVPVMPVTGLQVASPTMVAGSFGVINRSYYPTIAVSAEGLVVPMNNQKSAVWMLDNVDR